LAAETGTTAGVTSMNDTELTISKRCRFPTVDSLQYGPMHCTVQKKSVNHLSVEISQSYIDLTSSKWKCAVFWATLYIASVVTVTSAYWQYYFSLTCYLHQIA